ncbi:PDZ domain-containing protein [Cohnella faecalis]|uniref:PDZ domain-containing protein n=1 Tax=Cohnella faecalis TaxID=2315694 RepID=A0A398CNL7_9BACL|nr:PDZ domain-containing protein [Cohnella faecalis]
MPDDNRRCPSLSENQHPSHSQSAFRRYRTAIVIGILIVVFLVANSISWPYVLYGPGSAEPVHPRVETGKKLDEKGSLLFTTVSTYSKPNVFSLIYAWLNPRMDIETEEKATGGAVNYTAYRNLLAYMRDSSESNALLAAYNVMKKEIDVKEEGVIVYTLLKESKAAEHGLQEGDIITSVDGKSTLNVTSMIDALSSKKAGDNATLKGTRGGKPFEATVPLIAMPGEQDRAGVGFKQQTVLKVTPPDPVKFDFNDTGGPSAGLMMTLEIVAQLTGEDLSRGYRIAGTGTIAHDGTVGQIGGIQYKLMAADKQKADYFLVPFDSSIGLADLDDPKLTPAQRAAMLNAIQNGHSNWTLAQQTVADLAYR